MSIKFDPTKPGYYTLYIWSDVEPQLSDVFDTPEQQLKYAREIYKNPTEDPLGGLYRVNYDPKDGVTVSPFTAEELES